MLRFYFALAVAKICFIAIKLFSKSGGTSFAGVLALKLCPDFLKYASNFIKGTKISITGTNGKTTTAGILAHIIKSSGKKTLHNEKGANMLSGVANAFVEVLPACRDICVIESDEAYLRHLYDFMKFDYLIVTNLFKDQLDRYGELDTTASKIENAISKNPNLKLLLNADDTMVRAFGKGRDAIYFGFEKKSDYKGTLEDKMLNVNGAKFTLPLNGKYNAYNALAAMALAFEEGYLKDDIQKALSTYKPAFGRYQTRFIKGREAVVQLIKNPTGTNEVLKTVDLKSNILVAINDNYADGRDVSWLWDSDFELIKNLEGKIVISGIRALDMALRLKYAGVAEENIAVVENIGQALDYLIKNSQGKITILPSYTALGEL